MTNKTTTASLVLALTAVGTLLDILDKMDTKYLAPLTSLVLAIYFFIRLTKQERLVEKNRKQHDDAVKKLEAKHAAELKKLEAKKEYWKGMYATWFRSNSAEDPFEGTDPDMW